MFEAIQQDPQVEHISCIVLCIMGLIVDGTADEEMLGSSSSLFTKGFIMGFAGIPFGSYMRTCKTTQCSEDRTTVHSWHLGDIFECPMVMCSKALDMYTSCKATRLS